MKTLQLIYADEFDPQAPERIMRGLIQLKPKAVSIECTPEALAYIGTYLRDKEEQIESTKDHWAWREEPASYAYFRKFCLELHCASLSVPARYAQRYGTSLHFAGGTTTKDLIDFAKNPINPAECRGWDEQFLSQVVANSYKSYRDGSAEVMTNAHMYPHEEVEQKARSIEEIFRKSEGDLVHFTSPWHYQESTEPLTLRTALSKFDPTNIFIDEGVFRHYVN